MRPYRSHDGADNEGSNMFKLTEKAKQFNERFIIKHDVNGDYDLSSDYFCVNEAVVYEAKDAECSVEEMSLCIVEYTPEEVLAAAESGYGWPINLGLVEEEENLENIDDSLLKKCVCAVDENNRCNNASWRDWQGGYDIIKMYAPNEWCDEVRWVLDRAVESNGESLKEDLPAVELAVWGQNLSGSFFDRK